MVWVDGGGLGGVSQTKAKPWKRPKGSLPQVISSIGIEERKYLLEVEKALAGHHVALAALRERTAGLVPQDVDEALEAALWHLGVAIVRASPSRSDG